MPKPHFTVDWTSDRISYWERGHLDKFIGEPIKALEIGTFEGRSAHYFLSKILTHPEASLLSIDPYLNPIHQTLLSKAKALAIRNLEEFGSKVTLIHDFSYNILPHLKPEYSLAYVDGDHSFYTSLADMVTVFTLLKPGGIMLIDDLAFNRATQRKVGLNCPREAFKVFKALNLPFRILWEQQNAGIEKL